MKLASDEIARETFQGRSTEGTTRDLSMAVLTAKAAGGSQRELSFAREGTGTLFYTARMRYAIDRLFQAGLDQTWCALTAKGLGPDDSDQELVASPDGRFLFAVNQGSNSISVFRIRPSGALELFGGSVWTRPVRCLYCAALARTTLWSSG